MNKRYKKANNINPLKKFDIGVSNELFVNQSKILDTNELKIRSLDLFLFI